MNIIPTLTVMKNLAEYEFMIDNFISSGSKKFRCNATRFTNEVYLESIQTLQEIYFKKTNMNFDLILDIPCPKDKYRLEFTYNNNEIYIEKGELINVTNLRSMLLSDKDLFVEIKFDDISIDDEIIIGDGEVSLRVMEITKHLVKCVSIDSGNIGIRKAVYLNNNYCSMVSPEKKNNYIQLIKMLRPSYIALSFIENAQEVIEYKELIRASVGYCPTIIAKIETPKAIKNIEEILHQADEVLLGRGDLALCGAYSNLYSNQSLIIKACKIMSKKFYVATDILNSLVYNNYPSRSEICDVSNLIEQGCENFIFSGPLCRYGQYTIAVKYLKEISKQI